jgi:predicted DNA-binding WGR domain protein
MNQRSLRYTDGTSDKFWEIQLADASHTVRYGRYGTAGQTQTKEFDGDDAALKSFEKLVAEKLKKGYVDDGTAIVPTQHITTPAKSAKPKAPEVPTIEASELAQLNYPPVRSLNLNPEDWFWATWRDLKPLSRPEPNPFNLQNCLARLRKVDASSYYGWNFSNVDIESCLSPEESQFWLAAIVEPTQHKDTEGLHARLTRAELGEILAKKNFDGVVSLDEVTQCFPVGVTKVPRKPAGR